MKRAALALLLALHCWQAGAAERFPLADVRLGAGPFRDAQDTNLRYLLALDPDRLLAPFLREAGLAPRKDSYGNWESSGLDGHMGGHYLSALALMLASTGDAEVRRRLDYVIAELKVCQQAGGNGYLGGIPGGAHAWQAVARGELQADNFSVNGKWVPWYNLHKVAAGLRDAYRYAGSSDARAMLVAFSEWAISATAGLSDEQMQHMLRSEHGGMNEVFADVYQMTGERKYLDLARRFSHQAILQPLLRGEDRLTGLHANTQIPKVIGFQRIGALTGEPGWQAAADTFWRTVRDKRTVAIGGNSVKEHFHGERDFAPMINEVEGPETCNTYNMLRLSEMLFLHDPQVRYADYIERALYNHILSSQRPDGGFVYFTPMRPNHYRVYSQPQLGMWCCVGSGIESQSKHGEFIYAHDGDTLYVNQFIASTLSWRARGITLTQSTRFPDQDTTRLTVEGRGDFTLKLRYPSWVAPGRLQVRVNGRPVAVAARPGSYVSLRRSWKPGDRLDLRLPMRTSLEQMPDKSSHYAVLHGPIVLAAKTKPIKNELLQVLAGEARMDHIAHGAVCPIDEAPVFVSPTPDMARKIVPVPGQPLTFRAPGLIQGRDAASLRLIPFFRLHDARYMLYWPYSTPQGLASVRAAGADAEAARRALDARTIDQVAPGEQQPESDHAFKAEGGDAGIAPAGRWRHATGWFSYTLRDAAGAGTLLRLTFAGTDAGRRFDIEINGQVVERITLAEGPEPGLYTHDVAVPAGMAAAAGGTLTVRFVAREGSIAGGLYGLRLLK